MVRVKIEGDNEPKPSVPREEGSVPFIFVGKAYKFLGKGDKEPKPSVGRGGEFGARAHWRGARGTTSPSPPCLGKRAACPSSS